MSEDEFLESIKIFNFNEVKIIKELEYIVVIITIIDSDNEKVKFEFKAEYNFFEYYNDFCYKMIYEHISNNLINYLKMSII